MDFVTSFKKIIDTLIKVLLQFALVVVAIVFVFQYFLKLNKLLIEVLQALDELKCVLNISKRCHGLMLGKIRPRLYSTLFHRYNIEGVEGRHCSSIILLGVRLQSRVHFTHFYNSQTLEYRTRRFL